jgi:predicted Zn-dependent peptidase
VSFRHETLPNGLEVIAEVSDSALSASVGFFVNTGSRDESDQEWGVSHFLEHMVFKGTDTLSADDINRRFDDLGAAANAFTSEEDTVYYASVLPEHQREAVELIGAILRPALREKDFETEKLVILEEIQMYDDQPPFGADDICRAAFLAGHPAARSVLGTLDSVRGIHIDQMREYHRRRYAPGNIVLAATGAIDFADLVETARRVCGEWEPCQAGSRVCPLPTRAAGGGGELIREQIVRETAALEYVIRLSAGPNGDDPERYAAKWLAMMLGDESGSRFYWEFIDSGAADYASCHHQDFLDVGVFGVQLSSDAESIEQIVERTEEILTDVTANGLTPDEMEQARSKLASRIVLSGERARRRLFGVGLEWAHSRRYRSVADDLGVVETLTASDLGQLLERWPLSGSHATVLAGPLAPAGHHAH